MKVGSIKGLEGCLDPEEEIGEGVNGAPNEEDEEGVYPEVEVEATLELGVASAVTGLVEVDYTTHHIQQGAKHAKQDVIMIPYSSAIELSIDHRDEKHRAPNDAMQEQEDLGGIILGGAAEIPGHSIPNHAGSKGSRVCHVGAVRCNIDLEP